MILRATLALLLVFGLNFGNVDTVTFDSGKVGFVPPGWSITSTNSQRPGRWQVQADKTAPSKPLVFAQLSMRSGRADSSIALFDKNACQDGDVSVVLKLVSGRMEQSAGVIWRFQDTANYYFAVASANKGSVEIYKKANNAVSLLAHASVRHPIDPKEWNLLKVAFRGPRVVLYFGHRKLIDAQDTTLANAGKTGLWTKADTVAYFDNFRLNKKN